MLPAFESFSALSENIDALNSNPTPFFARSPEYTQLFFAYVRTMAKLLGDKKIVNPGETFRTCLPL